MNKPSAITEREIKCIAGNSTIYTLKTCTHCQQQKQVLGDYIKFFNNIDCATNMQICNQNKITAVPTWIINNQSYSGVKTFAQLKSLTGC